MVWSYYRPVVFCYDACDERQRCPRNVQRGVPRSRMFVSSDSVRHLIKATGGHCEYVMSLMLFSGANRPCALHIRANLSVYHSEILCLMH